MLDFGRSDDPRVQTQLERLARLSVPQGRLGLDTIRALMDRLGNPHRNLPPVFHVAGTNGKGSVCAFLRAMLEADSKLVHVTTSPHLVRYNERIRIAGELISDAALAVVLEEVLDAGEDLGPSFFEVTIAAAFLTFSRTPADACVVEVGMGGRFDATNVLEPEAVAACGIAALGLDHEKFLLAPEDGVPKDSMARIAFEKAGVAKRSVPLVAMNNGEEPDHEIALAAKRVGAILFAQSKDWCIGTHSGSLEDGLGKLDLPSPSLVGEHQRTNAGLAATMLRAQRRISISDEAILEGVRTACWPARMQLLSPGPLTALAPEREVWLDGGHNPSAGEVVAANFANRPLHLVLGMIDNKNPRALLDPLGDRVRSLAIVPVSGHDSHPSSVFGAGARAAADLEEALLSLPIDDCPVLIAGSLYLAGEALKLNDEIPA